MKLKQLLSLTRQALEHYQMIEENDKIAVGVSGGKDSLTLLYALSKLQHYYPIPFELCAITVDLGFEGFSVEGIQQFCDDLEVPLHVVPTQIQKIVFEERQETSPCSLCAKLRKGALNDKVIELGYKKIAYAHHMDDVIETMMMSMFYEGRFHTFSPVTHLEKTKLTLIRPMIYVLESQVKRFRYDNQLPVEKNPCTRDGFTKRESVKQLIHQLKKDDPQIKKRLFHSITNGTLPAWSVTKTQEEG